MDAAKSTPKGIEDMAMELMDMPMAVDELQHQIDIDASGKTSPAALILYFLGNRMRRTTSSKTQVKKGGEYIPGVGIYGAELAIAERCARGAQYRAIEMHGHPLENEAQSEAVRTAATEHAGAIASALVREIGDGSVYARDAKNLAQFLRKEYPRLAADDPHTIAAAVIGLSLVGQATRRDTTATAKAMMHWLAQYVTTTRESTPDEAAGARAALMTLIESGSTDDWTMSGKYRYLTIKQQIVVWQTQNHWDVNPGHPDVVAALKPFKGFDGVKASWAARGWIEAQGGQYKVKSRNGGRVIRLNVSVPDHQEHDQEQNQEHVDPVFMRD